MQKRLAVLFIFLLSVMAFGSEEIEIKKEVTGVDRQILEQSEGVEEVDTMQENDLREIDVNLKSNDLKNQRETLTVEHEKSNDDLEAELSKEMADDKSWLKYILGGLLLVVGIVAI